jgi:hypothetical protein
MTDVLLPILLDLPPLLIVLAIVELVDRRDRRNGPQWNIVHFVHEPDSPELNIPKKEHP